jgi:hypothetical protein
MAMSCESHGRKSTMLVGSMFHWYKAKCLKSMRISIRRQFWGLISHPNFAFFAKFLQSRQFSGKRQFPNFARRVIFLKK